jgi:hypothetical protein
LLPKPLVAVGFGIIARSRQKQEELAFDSLCFKPGSTD